MNLSRINPNIITCLGLVITIPASLMIARGDFLVASMLLALSGLCDVADGYVARRSHQKTIFGALLDSSLDRYADFFAFGGFIFYWVFRYEWGFAVLALSALAGSFEISYIRARAEGLGFTAKMGFWERPERWVFLILCLIGHQPEYAVSVLGVLTHGTALQRLHEVARQIRATGSKNEVPKPVPSKLSLGYWAQWVVLGGGLLILLMRRGGF